MVNTQGTSALHLQQFRQCTAVVSNPSRCSCSQTAMNEVFKVLVLEYVKHLVKVRQDKLTKLWRVDVPQTLREDAELLRKVMEDLVRFS